MTFQRRGARAALALALVRTAGGATGVRGRRLGAGDAFVVDYDAPPGAPLGPEDAALADFVAARDAPGRFVRLE